MIVRTQMGMCQQRVQRWGHDPFVCSPVATADLQTSGVLQYPVVKKRQIRRAAANVRVQHLAVAGRRQRVCTGTSGGQNTLQPWPGRGHHKVTHTVCHCAGYPAGVALLDAFAGEDHRAGVQRPGRCTGLFQLLVDDGLHPGQVNLTVCQRGKVNGTLV